MEAIPSEIQLRSARLLWFVNGKTRIVRAVDAPWRGHATSNRIGMITSRYFFFIPRDPLAKLYHFDRVKPGWGEAYSNAEAELYQDHQEQFSLEWGQAGFSRARRIRGSC